jgi:hypothetical protein
MPRCPTHCPHSNNSPLLAAAILAGAVALIAARALIMHVLIVLVITLGIVSGLSASALAVVIVIRLHGNAHQPLAPGRKLQAHAEVLGARPVVDADQRQITAGRTAARGRHQTHASGHHPAPAIEQRHYRPAQGSRNEQHARAMDQTPGRTPGASQAPHPRPDRGGQHHA